MLKIKAALYSETLVAIYQNTRRHELYVIRLRTFCFFSANQLKPVDILQGTWRVTGLKAGGTYSYHSPINV
jgi:hypothetical protein